MRCAVLVFMITVLAAGYTLAADKETTNGQQKSIQTRPGQEASFMGRYSRALSTMISGALEMDITADQKKAMSSLRDKYLTPISTAENSIRQSNMDIVKMLRDPSFDPAKVKKEMDDANAEMTKVMNRYVDALASLRDTVGKEKYQTLSNSQYRYRNDLIQMRNRSMRRTPPTGGVNRSNGSGQPAQPKAQTQDSGN